MFYDEPCKISQENKVRICKHVRLSRQRSWEEGGISGRIVECLHFIFYLLLNCSEREKTGTGEVGRQQPLPYLGMWLQKLVSQSPCPWTTELQVVGIDSYRGHFQPRLAALHSALCICLKSQARPYERSRLFCDLCCCVLIYKQFW